MLNFKNVRKEVGAFLATLPSDVITIGLLRFGAHLPHVGLPLRSARLLLSHMVEFFPPAVLREKRFLLLDDTMYRGASMDKAREKLLRCGVPPDNIQTAAAVVHADCARPVDYRHQTLEHHDYIAWKEELAAVVRNDIRPTERDHPLYYFEWRDFDLGRFLSALQEVGNVQPGHVEGPESLLRFSVTLGKETLHDLASAPGVEIAEPLKVKIYCSRDLEERSCQMTMVPIVPTILRLSEFRGGGAREQIASSLNLAPDFFELATAGLPAHAADAVTYYYASRGFAGALLIRVIEGIKAVAQDRGAAFSCVRPELVDDPVEYIFPDTYSRFHAAIYEQLERISTETPRKGGQRVLFPRSAPALTVALPTDPVLPASTVVLQYIDSVYRAAEWKVKSWEPSDEPSRGVTHRDLLQRFGDPNFIATSVDDLLDYGLLRAIDMPLGGDEYGRVLLAGGEYKAVEVTRIANAWGARKDDDLDAFCEEEALELWGA